MFSINYIIHYYLATKQFKRYYLNITEKNFNLISLKIKQIIRISIY